MLVIRPWGYKTFSCSTQLSTKFILLINVKMPTIVGILKFISMINTTSERLKSKHIYICWYYSFYEHLKFYSQLSWARKKFYNLKARAGIHKMLVRIAILQYLTYTKQLESHQGVFYENISTWINRHQKYETDDIFKFVCSPLRN